VRFTSKTPRRSSSWESDLLTAEGVTFSSRAAFVRLPVSAIFAKAIN